METVYLTAGFVSVITTQYDAVRFVMPMKWEKFMVYKNASIGCKEVVYMTNKERFNDLRRRLWNLLGTVDFSEGCKSYEGALEVHVEYPDYFFCLANNEDKPLIPEPMYYEITLHCYVLGDSRHYKFKGKTFGEALDGFEKWIVNEEKIEEKYRC